MSGKTATGEESVEIEDRERSDLIIIGNQLPGVDGLEAIERIRASETSVSISIIAFTSHAMTGDRERLLAGGRNGYLEKPINPEAIMADLNVYLAKKYQGNAAENTGRPALIEDK